MAKTIKQSKLGRYLDTRILSRMRNMRFKPRGRVVGDLAGDHKSTLSGFATEFAGYRQYVPGDDLKHLDWKAYYKSGRYYIKQYDVETNMIAHILLDVSESMKYGEGRTSKWEYAATLASNLAYIITAKRDKVGFGMFDTSVVKHMPPSQSIYQMLRLDSLLGEQTPREKTDIHKVFMDFANRIGRRGVVLIISDFFDDVDKVLQGIQRFCFDNHDVVAFHIMHRDELTFPFDENVRFDGLEGVPELKTDAQQIRKRYRNELETYLRKFTKGCEDSGVEYILMDTSVPLEITLAEYLMGRS